MNAYEHPEVLKAMPDAAFNNYVTQNFTPETQKALAKLRSDAQNGKIDTGPASLNESVFKTELNNRMGAIGLLDNTGKPKDKDQAYALNNYMRTEALNYQQQTGQKMTEQQLTQFIDNKFLKSTDLPGTLYGTNPKPTMAISVSDIPSAQMTQIKQALAAKGNTNPSNDQLLRTYWTGTK